MYEVCSQRCAASSSRPCTSAATSSPDGSGGTALLGCSTARLGGARMGMGTGMAVEGTEGRPGMAVGMGLGAEWERRIEVVCVWRVCVYIHMFFFPLLLYSTVFIIYIYIF